MLLAPVVKNRKGEHVKLIEQLAAQGYIRARIDGDVIIRFTAAYKRAVK